MVLEKCITMVRTRIEKIYKYATRYIDDANHRSK